MSNKVKLPESKNYVAEIGTDEKEKAVYLLINKYTGVIEYETSILPQIITVMSQFEDALEEFQIEGEIETPKTSDVIQMFPTKH